MVKSTAIKIIKGLVGLIFAVILAGCIVIIATRVKAQTISSKAASAVAEIAQENGTLTYLDFQTIWKSIKLYEPANTLGDGDTSNNFRYYDDPIEGRKVRHWINIDNLHVYKTEDWLEVKNGTKTLGDITDYVSRNSNDDYKNVVQRGTALTAVVDVTINIDLPFNMNYGNGKFMFGNEKGTLSFGTASIPAQTISTKYYKGLDD